jgi:peptide-methionine (S)-S-oxide reductase
MGDCLKSSLALRTILRNSTGKRWTSARSIGLRFFYSDPEQKKIAEAYVKQLEQAKIFPAPIVTQVVKLKAFYPAEELHQNYCNRNPRNSWVVRVGQPMVDKTKEELPELLKK